jgi:hypothetical protein
MRSSRQSNFYRSHWYVRVFCKVTSLVLAFSFSVASPLSLAVAYAQTTSDNSLQTPPPQTDTTTTDQGSTTGGSTQSGLNFSPTGNPGDMVSAPDSGGTTGGTSNVTAPSPNTDQSAPPVSDTPPKTPPSSPGTLSLQYGGDAHTDDNRNSIATQQLLQPDTLTGALNYTYPLSVPPGRGKLRPDLALIYSSQPSANANTVGYGWTTNIPYIERINRTGSDMLYNQDYYYSSVSGELASTTGTTTYAAKVENGDFLNYAFSNNTWTVTDKMGTTYKFGTSTASRQDDPNDGTRIFKWMLSEVRDTNGNYVRYEYSKETGQIYPSRIIYSGNGSTDGPIEVSFLKQARNDVATSSIAQFNIVSSSRIYEIDEKVSGTLVKKYVLGYTTGDNGVRSLLSSVTETGYDDSSNAISLPATSFSYQRPVTTWTASTTWNPQLFFIFGAQGGDTGARIIDANADGLQDIAQYYKQTSGTDNQTTRINNGNDFNDASSTWYLPIRVVDNTAGGDQGVRFADVNGDGKIDIIQGLFANGATTSGVYINNGAGWTASSTWTLPTNFIQNGTDVGSRIVDVNGDGLPDIVLANALNGTTTQTWLNTGHGWTNTRDSGTNYFLSPTIFMTGAGDRAVTFADVNGDGLPDIVQWFYVAGTGDIKGTWLNTGTGWATASPEWNLPTNLLDGNVDRGVRIVDVNGDGLPDLVQRAGPDDPLTYVWLNDGNGWNAYSTTTWQLPVAIVDAVQLPHDHGVRFADVNGDGMPDVLRGYDDNNNNQYYDAWLNDGKLADILLSVTNPRGGTTTITYKGAAQYFSSGSPLNSKLPIPLTVVNTVTNNDGLGTYATTSYTYSGGSYFYNQVYDRKLGGFNKITATDDAGNYTNTFFHTGSGTDGAHGEYADAEAKIGKSYRSENYDPANNLYAKTVTRWDQVDLGNNRKFVEASTTLAMTYDGNSSHKDSATGLTHESSHGNLIQQINYGQVNGNDDGTFSDTGSDLASTTIMYAASSTNSTMAGLVATSTTQDQSSNKVSETRHYYDGLSIGSVGAGNETKTEAWKSGSSYASTTKTYDGTYGLVTQSKDADGNTTTYTLDSNNLYSATTTNSLSQATGYVYDYASGKVKRTFDPNSSLYTTTYDALRRPLTANEPDPSSGSLVTKTSYTYTDSSTPGSTSVQETDNLNSATSTNTYSYYDGLGRTIQARTTAQGTNTYAVKDQTYNNLGLLNTESLPYFASSTSRSSATSTSALFTTWPEVTKRSDLTHKRTNHELRPPYERHRARP